MWSARDGWEAYNAAVFGAAVLFELALTLAPSP